MDEKILQPLEYNLLQHEEPLAKKVKIESDSVDSKNEDRDFPWERFLKPLDVKLEEVVTKENPTAVPKDEKNCLCFIISSQLQKRHSWFEEGKKKQLLKLEEKQKGQLRAEEKPLPSELNDTRIQRPKPEAIVRANISNMTLSGAESGPAVTNPVKEAEQNKVVSLDTKAKIKHFCFDEGKKEDLITLEEKPKGHVRAEEKQFPSNLNDTRIQRPMPEAIVRANISNMTLSGAESGPAVTNHVKEAEQNKVVSLDTKAKIKHFCFDEGKKEDLITLEEKPKGHVRVEEKQFPSNLNDTRIERPMPEAIVRANISNMTLSGAESGPAVTNHMKEAEQNKVVSLDTKAKIKHFCFDEGKKEDLITLEEKPKGHVRAEEKHFPSNLNDTRIQRPMPEAIVRANISNMTLSGAENGPTVTNAVKEAEQNKVEAVTNITSPTSGKHLLEDSPSSHPLTKYKTRKIDDFLSNVRRHYNGFISDDFTNTYEGKISEKEKQANDKIQKEKQIVAKSKSDLHRASGLWTTTHLGEYIKISQVKLLVNITEGMDIFELQEDIKHNIKVNVIATSRMLLPMKFEFTCDKINFNKINIIRHTIPRKNNFLESDIRLFIDAMITPLCTSLNLKLKTSQTLSAWRYREQSKQQKILPESELDYQFSYKDRPIAVIECKRPAEMRGKSFVQMVLQLLNHQRLAMSSYIPYIGVVSDSYRWVFAILKGNYLSVEHVKNRIMTDYFKPIIPNQMRQYQSGTEIKIYKVKEWKDLYEVLNIFGTIIKATTDIIDQLAEDTANSFEDSKEN